MASASILDLPPGLKEKVFSNYLFVQTFENCPSEQNFLKKGPSEDDVIGPSEHGQSQPGKIHFLIGKFSYFVIRFLH